MKRNILILLSLLFSTLILTSCVSYYNYDENKINITATTNIMGNLAEIIGDERVNVYSLMGAGIDPHQYVARPHDYNALNKADFILVSGLHLEGKLSSIIDNYQKNTDKHVLLVGDTIINRSDLSLTNKLIENEDFGDNYDPHFWFDLDLYKEAAKYVLETLSYIEPENEDYFINNYLFYIAEIDELEVFIINELSKLNNLNKILISSHDAFEYFGNMFGFKVYALQGLSTEDQISPKDVLEIVDIVINENVKAIFPETSVPSETIMSVREEVLKKGSLVNIGKNLYSDSLGDSETDNTYIKMYKLNVTNIVEAFLKEG